MPLRFQQLVLNGLKETAANNKKLFHFFEPNSMLLLNYNGK